MTNAAGRRICERATQRLIPPAKHERTSRRPSRLLTSQRDKRDARGGLALSDELVWRGHGFRSRLERNPALWL